MNKLKTKIYIALVFLALIIISLGIFGSLFIGQLGDDSRAILQDNYKSVEFVSAMLSPVDSIYELYINKYHTDRSIPDADIRNRYMTALDDFGRHLLAEKNNITESGEKHLTEKLSYSFQNYKNLTACLSGSNTPVPGLEILNSRRNELRNVLAEIQELNMQAIRHKNKLAEDTAARVSLYMILLSATGTLFAFVLIIYFPGYLLSPLYDLMNRMKEITQGKADKKLMVNSRDEIGELANAFNTNISEYQERNTAKTFLLATVSHELKTPISSINLSLKLLENAKLGDLNNEQKKVVESVRQQTRRLSKMVNELLDYSQAETGNIKLRMSSNHPSDIMDYAATALMVQLAEKNIQLDINMHDGLPHVYVDIEKTVWVLTNLITNAERYTHENGTITVEISVEKDFVVFSVHDNGPGIPAEEHGNIFNKFVQVGDSNTKGRGLGLAISREFVLAQGGNIWVKSQLGTGSTFFFTLPAVMENNNG